MKWNADFEIAAIIVEAIFIFFFFGKKHLPTRKNRFFSLCMVVSVFVCFFDLLSAYMDSNWRNYSSFSLQLVNVLYFLIMTVLTMSFFVYVLLMTESYEVFRSPVFYVYCIPFMVHVFLDISTPFTGYLYYFHPTEGYCHGPAYLLSFLMSASYVLLSAVYVIVKRKRITYLQFNSVIAFVLIIAVGVTVQSVLFRWVLLSNAVICLAIIIIYLSLQNPDMYIDKATSLFNVDGFYEMAAEYKVSEEKYEVIVVTLENMRIMQSVYGNDRVNEALVNVVGFIEELCGKNILFRISEDSFAVLNVGSLDYRTFSDKVIERFKEPFRVANGEVLFSAYVICLPYQFCSSDIKTLSKTIRFVRKRRPGNSAFVVMDDEIAIDIDRDTSVERALEKAIDNNTVQIYLQPIYDTRTGKAHMAEVLARLFDEEVGFISPNEFIVKAEENGNVVELGRQIFEKACIFIRDNDLEKMGIDRLDINLSAYQCMRESMADEMLDIAQRHGVEMSRFCFEIVESSADVREGFLRNNMDRLIQAGAIFVLDDYGIGYSNFVNLLRLPFKLVKMDKSLVWTYFENDSDVLPDVMETFRNQKLGIVAQGVESKAMAKRLIMMGCDALQGYFFSKPVPARDFARLMTEKNVEGGFGV